jgi:peptidoglycan/xylan/chitin deacetylase (PgdA/CDA1 family)
MAADPLVTIGGHTKGHFAISKLSEARALDEMVGGADRIEQELGSRPIHFAFPYGDPGSAGPRDFALTREAGFKTAVITRKGMLFPAHRRHLTALLRVSLNGNYQSLTYTALYCRARPSRCGIASARSTRHKWLVQSLHPADQQPRRDDPGKPRGDEEGELHPLWRQRDAA